MKTVTIHTDLYREYVHLCNSVPGNDTPLFNVIQRVLYPDTLRPAILDARTDTYYVSSLT